MGSSEVLAWLEWESLARPVEFDVDDSGDFDGVEEATASRNEALGIAITFRGRAPNGEHSSPALKAGEMMPEPAVVSGRTSTSSSVVVRGASERNRVTRGDGLLTIDADCHEVEVVHNAEQGKHCVEWLVNHDISPWAYPRVTERSWSNEFTRQRDKATEVRIDFSKPIPSLSINVDHLRVQFSIGGHDTQVLVGVPPKDVCDETLKPGFVQYSEDYGHLPSDEERLKIISALSFAFGRQVVPIGETWFNAEWFPAKTVSRAPHYLGRLSAFGNPSYPPRLSRNQLKPT